MNLQPILMRVKCFKGMDKKMRNRYYRLLLLDEISNMQKRLKLLTKLLEMKANILNDSTTWMKGICIQYSINIVIVSYVKNIHKSIRKNLTHYCGHNALMWFSIVIGWKHVSYILFNFLKTRFFSVVVRILC